MRRHTNLQENVTLDLQLTGTTHNKWSTSPCQVIVKAQGNVSITTCQPIAKTSHIHTSKQNMGLKYNMQPTKIPPQNSPRKKKVYPRGCMSIPLLCTSSWLHNALCIRISSITTSKSNKKHNDKSKANFRLCTIQPWHHRHLLSKRHGNSSSQWRILSIRNKSTQQSMRPFLLLQRWTVHSQQWLSTNGIPNHQSSNDVYS